MAASLAADTREAFASAKAGLAQFEVDLVTRARASTNGVSGERDRLLESIVVAYRFGDRQLWAAVLLDLLTPAILERLRHFRPEPPAIDLEDVRAEFVVQLLEAAATMPLPPELRFVERRMILRAGQGVRRWLRKERRWRGKCQPLESLAEKESK
jgi:hypothetical protein